MRILTYNVHGWKTPAGDSNIPEVEAILRSSGADLVALNEVFVPCEDTGENGLFSLAAALEMDWAFGGVQHEGYGRCSTLPTEYGNACLSRYPIQAYASHRLPPGTSGGERILLEVRISLPEGSPLTLYITHLDHRSEAYRLQQWKEAQAWLGRDRDKPHVLLGDLNALAESDYALAEDLKQLTALHAERGWSAPEFGLIRSILASGYTDAAAACRVGAKATWPAHEPERRVDYFFLSPALKDMVVDCQPLHSAPAADGSDHLPLVLDLALS